MSRSARTVKLFAGVVLAALVCLVVAGCGGEREEGPGMRVDWDLSDEHTLDQVAWQKENLDLDTTQLKPIESVRIRLPAGEVLRMEDRVSDIILYRRSRNLEPLPAPEGRVLTAVEVYSDPLNVEDAYQRALAYTDQFDLPRSAVEAWRKRREQGIDPVSDRTIIAADDTQLGGAGGPIPHVELVSTGTTWTVSVQLYWPPPRDS